MIIYTRWFIREAILLNTPIATSSWKVPLIIHTWCFIRQVILSNTPIANEIHRKVSSHLASLRTSALHFSKYFQSNSALNSSHITSWGFLLEKVEPMTESDHILAASWKVPVIIYTRCFIRQAILLNTPIADEIHRKVSSHLASLRTSALHFSQSTHTTKVRDSSQLLFYSILPQDRTEETEVPSLSKHCQLQWHHYHVLCVHCQLPVGPLAWVSIPAWRGAIREVV